MIPISLVTTLEKGRIKINILEENLMIINA